MALSQLDSFMSSLGQLESGNNYDAVGPYTGSTYGRAKGRWQIMEKIYPAWAREAGVNPNDFSPAAQERVARKKMTDYYNRYGSWDLVAVAWFAGPGAANKAKAKGISSVGGKSDMLGTTVTKYVQKVTAGMAASDPRRPTGGRPGGNAAAPGSPGPSRPVGGRPGGNAAAPASPGSYRPVGGRPGGNQAFSDSAPVSPSMLREGGQGQRLIAPIEAAPGTQLSAMQEQTRDDQISQDSLGSILSTISEAAKGAGGKILDLKGLFGMPQQEQPIVQGMPAPQPADELAGQPQPAESQPAAQADGPMAEPPKHDGFAGLRPEAQTGTQKLMGQFLGLRFTSGYRDPKRNSAANGVKTSKHLTGQASDFVGSEDEMQAAAKAAKAQGAVKTLIHDSGSGRHLHIEWA